MSPPLYAMHCCMSWEGKNSSLDINSSHSSDISLNSNIFKFIFIRTIVEEAKLHEQINEDAEASWEETLKPYVPFGLEYIIDPHYDGSEISMYYQGQEVRGIVDETRSLWITEHSGISAYSPDAVELYAVYENGKLSGLRVATEEEMEEWDYWRSRQTDENNSTEPRNNPNGTEEDYASLFALKTSDYQEMSLSDFNASILDLFHFG